ncbi:hypothetical protein LTR84_005879 [Exophiala bonariae]|uniref:Ubiquitin-like domain-containing protein n=1 Tax=Exophiala bonariae TaxID=1690606 RepID=A0AAV9N647_9EURO|nr:hypothetical protein LTR84_005879 [Exophiala bonariae]
MTPGFGFSVGDFITAIELCNKVAKALKDSGTAAAEYQHVILELQGLQNVLTRLAALEPTESNSQQVNAIRGAALASVLVLQEFLSKLEKFETSMSPFAAKKTLTMSRAGKQTQYALFMADEVKKMRAVIYGNVIRINVLLATHASESLSRTESKLANQGQALSQGFQDAKDDMVQIINEVAQSKEETIAYWEKAQRDAMESADQMQEISNKVETNASALTQRISSLSIALSSLAKSVSGARDLSSQILSLLRMIPAELGGLIQTVMRSNARIESTLLSMEQKLAASPSLSLETNIRLEDALGRIHADIPYEWFQYWETFEGLLKARFKDTPGRQKIENGDFRLVHAKRNSVSLDKDSWSGSITPGAQIVMLMLIKNVVFRNSSCPRRSCTAKIETQVGIATLVTCPECGLRFIPQMTPAGSADADEVARIQRTEDSKLFGKSAAGEEVESSGISRQILDITEDIEMIDVSGNDQADSSSIRRPRESIHKTAVTGTLADIEKAVGSASPSPQTPAIFSWLTHTVPPKDPGAVRQWRDAAENEHLEVQEREASDLEVFRNVQIVTPAEVGAPILTGFTADQSDEIGLEFGAQIYYRNMLDRYPKMDDFLARRLAIGNLQRQQRLTKMQREAEQAKIRAASRDNAPEGIRKRKIRRSRTQTETVDADVDGWEDVVAEFEEPPESPMRPHYLFDHITNPEHWTLPSDWLPGPLPGQFPGMEDLSFDQWLTNSAPYETWKPIMIKERRFCRLPPYRPDLKEPSNTSGSILCYLCHSRVHIPTKQSWRNHVMYDLQPYMCPYRCCTDATTMFSSRTVLLCHIKQHSDISVPNTTNEGSQCPFCDVRNLPSPLERGSRQYIKHIGHHMEEIAFGVVSTEHETWSYDESGSDEGPLKSGEHQFSREGNQSYLMHPGNNISGPRDDHPYAPPSAEVSEWQFWPELQLARPADFCYEQDETEKKTDFWTGTMRAASPASSANSGLRDPYHADHFSAGSADAESHGHPYRYSAASASSPTRGRTAVIGKHSKARTDKATDVKRVGRRKGPLRPDQRQQAREIRKLRACLRCKFLKKTCDKGDPCGGCNPSHARLWLVPCTRLDIKDLGYFLKNWKVDYERHVTLGFSVGNIKGFSDAEQTVLFTHGYGHYFPLDVREVWLRDDRVLGVDWLETKRTEVGDASNEHFEIDTASLSCGTEGVSMDRVLGYLQSYIDGDFELFIDEYFEGTPFLTECLKTTHRYYLKDRSAVLKKALLLILAYSLTLSLTLMLDDPEGMLIPGRVRDPTSRLCGQIAAPVMVNFQIKTCLADIWREIHKDLLEELGSLYSAVYSGDKLKNWDKIFFATLAILVVWEEMQFDCHYRIPDHPVVDKFCSDMEATPVGVLTNLFCAISTKVPRFEEWDTHQHAHLFPNRFALHDALTDVRTHVVKHEGFLRSRLRDTKFDCNDFDSLSNKFLSRLVLREPMASGELE